MPLGDIGDVFQFKLKTQYQGQVGLNVFYYEQTTLNNHASANSTECLSNAFAEDVAQSIVNIQTDDLTVLEYEIINLFNPDDLFSDTTLTHDQGSLTGVEGLATFIAFEYQTARVSRSVRRGAKRFWAMPESWLTDGVYNGTNISDVTAVATAMNATIQASGMTGSPSFKPVTVKRIPYTGSEGQTLYRLPETALESNTYPAVFAFSRVSTQNSRKTW